jgi:hypothetical protein
MRKSLAFFRSCKYWSRQSWRRLDCNKKKVVGLIFFLAKAYSRRNAVTTSATDAVYMRNDVIVLARH